MRGGDGVRDHAPVAAGLALVMCAVAACTSGGAGARPAPTGSVNRVTRTRAAARIAFPLSCRRLADPKVKHTAIGDRIEPLLPARLPSLGTPVRRWRPLGRLPLPAARGVRVVVVLTPHPDDETLSMGVLIHHWSRADYRVILVALTDGEHSRTWLGIDRRLHVRPVYPALVQPGMPQVTVAQIAQSRIAEMRQAAVALGIAPADIYLAHLDSVGSSGGKHVTVLEVLALVRAFAARYPGATFVTMSYFAERQPEHLAAGEAVCAAVLEHRVRHAVWAISRLYWRFHAPRACIAADPADRAAIDAAVSAYDDWDPAAGRYAVGYSSVGAQFQALRIDPRSCVATSGGTPLPPVPADEVPARVKA
ncbi:MAG: PIG-L family deacetylase [Frankiaceae bacterium]|nr:PIG-L family deacetylase [Frankiaceae bacterium]